MRGATPPDHSNLWKISWCVSLWGTEGSPRSGLQWLRYPQRVIPGHERVLKRYFTSWTCRPSGIAGFEGERISTPLAVE